MRVNCKLLESHEGPPAFVGFVYIEFEEVHIFQANKYIHFVKEITLDERFEIRKLLNKLGHKTQFLRFHERHQQARYNVSILTLQSVR